MDTDTTVTAARATPMQRLMFSVSPRPQYWLTSTAMPLWKPKITTWMMKMGTLAAVTAAISALPQQAHHEGVREAQGRGDQIL